MNGNIYKIIILLHRKTHIPGMKTKNFSKDRYNMKLGEAWFTLPQVVICLQHLHPVKALQQVDIGFSYTC